MLPGEPSDTHWLTALDQRFSAHAHFDARFGKSGAVSRSTQSREFCLRHYAGDVVYSVQGFCTKNTDPFSKDLSFAMLTSSTELLSRLFPEGDRATWMGAQRMPVTTATAFKRSIRDMIELLTLKVRACA